METDFAPSKRATKEEITIQQALFTKPENLFTLHESASELVAVLNRERQVIYANNAFVKFLGLDDAEQVYGSRVGELLSCIHADENPGGCGTAKDCRYCEAILTVLKTFETGESYREECMVYTQRNNQGVSLNFRLQTVPIEIGEFSFVLISIQDLSVEKHREALERIFFHDILNTVSSLKIKLDLLLRAKNPQEKLIKDANVIADLLANEIKNQQMIIHAENKTLRVNFEETDTLDSLKKIIMHFDGSPLLKGKVLELAPFSEAVKINTDSKILHRILVNAVKNALEASDKENTISIGSKKENGHVLFHVHNAGVIPPEVRARIFYRYFSTKGKNRGLGTYSMKLLTEQYLGGKVSFTSEIEKGTSFYITIPG
jgi:signal transduction histidine kinase